MAALLALAPVLLMGMGGQEQPPPSYVGQDTCAICHDEVAQRLSGTPHWTAFKLNLPDSESAGCESCHGPGQYHVDDPSVPLRTFREEDRRERDRVCADCHSARSRESFRPGVHQRPGLACTECHVSGHQDTPQSEQEAHLLKTEPLELCVSCHSDQKAQMTLPFRHRTSDGVLECTDCHNAHGRSVNRMRRLARREACFACHADKKGPFMFEHEVSTVTGCAACHEPHGSTNPKLLVRANVFSLCLECHPETPSTHDLTQSRYRNCTICHTAIHGSHSDSRFLR